MDSFSRQTIDTTRLPEALKAKWNSRVLEEGFIPFPKKLLRVASTLFDGPGGLQDLVVIMALIDYKRPHLSRDPSIEYLSFLSGLDSLQVLESLQRLEENGLLQLGSSENGGINTRLDRLNVKLESLALEQDLEYEKKLNQPDGPQAKEPPDSKSE